MSSKDLYLGFDLSTQQLKIVACYSNLKFHSKYTIEFDEFKLKYGINKGVISNDATGEVLTPIGVFLDAIETLFDRMLKDNFPFNSVKSINGSCQQHGTVYFTNEINDLLKSLNDNWSEHLKSGFSYPLASNWQDRSTGEEIKAFEMALGSATKLCELTGSRAHYRFSGPQMRRRAILGGQQWTNTSYLGLISSFLNTILCGKLRGVEISEAGGTNLLDIQRGDWDDELLSLVLGQNSKVDGVSKDLQLKASLKVRQMLGEVVLPNDGAMVAPYLVEKYGFNPNCIVWPITGDNMATIMALPLSKDDLLVSMGTSTTVLIITDKYVPSVNYHMFRHPVCPDLYMGMLCYCNGALAREQIRDSINQRHNTSGWNKFNEIVDNGSSDNVGIYFPLGEITPNVDACERRFHFENGQLNELVNKSNDEDAIMIVESQALSCRTRVCPLLSNAEKEDGDNDVNLNLDLGLEQILQSKEMEIDGVEYNLKEFNSRPKNVYYVGGTSKNESILRKFDQILGPRGAGFKVEIGDACALGGCFRAIWGSLNTDKGFENWLEENFDFEENVENVLRDDDVEVTWRSFMKKLGVLNLVEGELK